jgi:short subunit fatty acids transporter
MTATAAPLDSEHADFIRGGVSIIVAARDAGNETTVSRALGCRVAEDRSRVTVFVSAAQSGVLLADIGANGSIAVVFSQPTTHLAIQLKGTDAAVVPLTSEDPHLLAAYRSALAARVAPLGFTEAFIRTFLSVTPGDVVAIAFTPSAAFSQTPGPRAGSPLKSPA